jgi:hypothetical protein
VVVNTAGCDHVFCLTCIRHWRSQAGYGGTDARRACPLCRKVSYFVVPSPVFCTGAAKEALLARYVRTLRSRPCEYYSVHRDCPFGRHCFYRHDGPHGPVLDWSQTTRHGVPRETWQDAELNELLRALLAAALDGQAPPPQPLPPQAVTAGPANHGGRRGGRRGRQPGAAILTVPLATAPVLATDQWG